MRLTSEGGPGRGLFGRLMSSPGKILSRQGSRRGSRQESGAEVNHQAGGSTDQVLTPFPIPDIAATTAIPSTEPLPPETSAATAATAATTAVAPEKVSRKKKAAREVDVARSATELDSSAQVKPASLIEEEKKRARGTPFSSLLGKKENKAATSASTLPPIAQKR